MKFAIKTLSATLLASAALAVIPANAQVAGIATLDTTDAIMQTKAFAQAYQQIGTTFTSNSQMIQTKRKEINDINAQLDTNKDKNLTQDELDAAIKAKNPLLTQLETKEKEIGQLQQPIVTAQAFAVESIADRYAAAQQQVVTQKKISMILSPDAFIWAPEAVDVTKAVTTALDAAVPAVGITPPANWQPKQSTGPLYEQIQQRLLTAARMQAIRNAQAQQAAQPQGTAPAAPAPQQPQPESR
ncbi:MAG: OmpH family outer membrane protein [Sphingorhabdus sp.]|uniref:OmpH family outer membrane protein n=1 Tax=Sphingorhabdus sp. TaxID=1902408 RepID=UPI003CACD7B7